MRTAVIDSSPLINLAHLDLALELARYFDRGYIPRAVQRELNRKGRFRYRLNKLYATGIFDRCAAAGRVPSLQALVEVLRRDLRFRIKDELVREAIATATQPI